MSNIQELTSRLVANIIPAKEPLEKLLMSGRKLNVYLGIDPTSTRIHLGHTVPLRKLQAFAEAGHNVTFLIGDFTALVGDTSDKDSERPMLGSDQIEENFQTYKKQAEKVLDFSKVKVRHNSEWLSKLTFAEIIKLCQHFSLGDFISRELIKKRMDAGTKVRLDEVLYPVMQGYDSYFMDTDIQIGGTDQTFNMQAGRTLQKSLRGKESYIVATVFPLEGTDGRKMSKSWGNAIWIEDSPEDMFGKVMSLRDDLIIQYFTLATNVSMDRVEEVKKRLASGENPMVLKKELAFQIVSELHSKDAAQKAQEEFNQKYQQTNWSSPSVSLPTVQYKVGADISGILLESGLVRGSTEVKRLIHHGAIDINGTTISADIEVKPGDVIRIGKNRGVKVEQKK